MSQTEEIVCKKCASCYQILKDPVQEDVNGSNLICSQCSLETARKLISGTEIKLCDFPPANHGEAQWFCFDCGKNMCSECHIRHTPEGHKVSLLEHHAALKNQIWGGASSNVSSQEAEQTDSANQDNIACPICNGARCRHVQVLHSLIAGLQNCSNHCKQDGHVDANNKPLELKFFCKMCWTPICGDCSKGKHKQLAHVNHETDDMSDCGKEFVVKSLEVLHEKLEMLMKTSQRDAKEAVVSEKRLQSHVTDTDKELNARKMKVIEQTVHAFNMAISDAAAQGRSILTDYRENLNNIRKFQSFLTKINDALNNVDTDLEQAEISKYIGAFYLQEWANKLIQDLDEEYRRFPKLKEQRLVLPEMDVITTPPPCLAQVKTEVKQLKLAFSFELKGDYLWTNSIVLTDGNQCLISFKKYNTEFDGIVLCHYTGNNQAKFTEYEVEKGTYHLSRLSSGEIVASFSCYTKCAKTCRNKIIYFNGTLPEKKTELLFEDVHYFQFPPYGIATTKDNNIILCVCVDEPLPIEKGNYENKNLCQVISMSLRGKVLNTSLQKPNANFMRADYLAVSDNGEICISDTNNNNIVILNEDLTIKERMKYQLPTTMDGQNDTFRPHGVCYDTFGRIIVADPDNNSVVRLVRDQQSQKYILEPLLSKRAASGFIGPKLVALNKKHSHLWVVCTSHVFVFDYGPFMMPHAME